MGTRGAHRVGAALGAPRVARQPEAGHGTVAHPRLLRVGRRVRAAAVPRRPARGHRAAAEDALAAEGDPGPGQVHQAQDARVQGAPALPGAPRARARGAGAGGGGGEHLSPLLQLPHVEEATARALVKKAKVKTLDELQALDAGARAEALGQAGLSAAEVGKVEEALETVPKVTMTAEHSTYGEAEILNGDPVTVTVRLVLRRRAHAGLAKALKLRGQKVLASTPRLPHTRPEAWYILLVDPATNYLFCWQRVSLDEAEEIGMEEAIRARKASGAAEPAGEGAGRAQEVKMQFRAPPPGKYEPLLLCMSNAWIGCDAALGVSLDVDKEAKPKPEKGQEPVAGAAGDIMSDISSSSS